MGTAGGLKGYLLGGRTRGVISCILDFDGDYEMTCTDRTRWCVPREILLDITQRDLNDFRSCIRREIVQLNSVNCVEFDENHKWILDKDADSYFYHNVCVKCSSCGLRTEIVKTN